MGERNGVYNFCDSERKICIYIREQAREHVTAHIRKQNSNMANFILASSEMSVYRYSNIRTWWAGHLVRLHVDSSGTGTCVLVDAVIG